MAKDADKHARTKTLRRLLRRRSRRGKVGANSGEQTKIHAWHSSYAFTPSSDHSKGTRWGIPIAIFLALASPALVAVLWNLMDISHRYGTDFSMSGFVAVVFWVGLFITLSAPILLVWMAVASGVESHRAKRAKRLGAKSLNQQTMPPSDSAGITAIPPAENTANRNSG